MNTRLFRIQSPLQHLPALRSTNAMLEAITPCTRWSLT